MKIYKNLIQRRFWFKVRYYPPEESGGGFIVVLMFKHFDVAFFSKGG